MNYLVLLQSMTEHFFLQSAFVYIKIALRYKQFMYARKMLCNAQAHLVSK
jgi:hypothetical protein